MYSIPTYCLDRISFYTFHPPQITLVVPGKRQQLMETVNSLMAEGSLLMGLVDCLAITMTKVDVSPTNHKSLVACG